MTPTVDDLLDDIRIAVGRHEREVSSGFTKEALAAIWVALDYDFGSGRLPPKAEMRAAVRRRVDGLEGGDPDVAGGSFRKADLEAIAAALREE